MSTTFQPNLTGLMAYPSKGSVNRMVFKAPLIFWRMGLGPILGQGMMILTTWGRKSHQPRHTALSYTIHNGKAYLAPGWPENSDWYKNIQADPQVTVQLGEGYYHATARRVTDVTEFSAVAEELLTSSDLFLKPWLKSMEIDPELEDLINKRDRVMMLALDWSNEAGPAPMPIDLTWLWWVVGITYVIGWLMGRGSASKR